MAPSPSDFVRLRRALLGLLFLMLAQVITGFAVHFDRSTAIADGLYHAQ